MRWKQNRYVTHVLRHKKRMFKHGFSAASQSEAMLENLKSNAGGLVIAK